MLNKGLIKIKIKTIEITLKNHKVFIYQMYKKTKKLLE